MKKYKKIKREYYKFFRQSKQYLKYYDKSFKVRNKRYYPLKWLVRYLEGKYSIYDPFTYDS